MARWCGAESVRVMRGAVWYRCNRGKPHKKDMKEYGDMLQMILNLKKECQTSISQHGNLREKRGESQEKSARCDGKIRCWRFHGTRRSVEYRQKEDARRQRNRGQRRRQFRKRIQCHA